ncbi:MAG: glutamine amidotransferase [Armatimonadota bacterium]
MSRISLLLLLMLLVISPIFAGTDDDEAAKKGVTAPAEWIFPATKPLRVLAVHGRWYPFYALDRAYGRTGGALLTDAWHHVGDLRYYPESYEELMNHHLVVVCNANAGSFGPVRRAMLKHYVAAGGGVLFLGGKLAYDPAYRDTAFEEIAPVTFTEKDNRRFSAEGLIFAPGKEGLAGKFAKLPWAENPRVFWYHELTPKAGSTVLLTAGGKPLLITGTFGKGRVALFTGSVMGDPAAGLLPFWEWSGWPVMMAETMSWLTEPTRAARTASPELLAQMTAQLFKADQVNKAETLAPILTRIAGLPGSRDSALLLLRAVNSLDGDVPLDLVDVVWDGARPFVDGGSIEMATLLLDGAASSKVSLGLRTLGLVKAPGARTLLERWLKDPGVAGPGDPLDGDVIETVTEDTAYRAFAIRLGALEGLGNLADPGAIPVLNSYVRQYAKVKSDPTKWPLEVTREDELYQEALLSALRCGDAAAAGPVVDMLLENRYVAIRMLGFLDSPDYPGPEHEATRRMKRKIRREISRVYLRLSRLYAKLSPLPANVQPALATRLAAEEDPRVASIAFAAFGEGGKLGPEVVAALRTAKVIAVRDLAGEW